MNPPAEMLTSGISVLPVIHLHSTEHALLQARTAHAAGAHGVFLVNHETPWHTIIPAADAIRAEIGCWVGANALDLSPTQVFSTLCAEVALDGVWVDNARIDETSPHQPAAEEVDAARAGFGGLYFGGVAFKYQREVRDLAAAGRVAARHMDVVCTSGPATGVEAPAQKVAALAAACSPAPLAVASGVSVHNVEVIALAGARIFLAASSISSDWITLDPALTRALIERAHSLPLS